MTDLPHRDIEKVYAVADLVAKLHRLADALEQQQPFTLHRYDCKGNCAINSAPIKDELGFFF